MDHDVGCTVIVVRIRRHFFCSRESFHTISIATKLGLESDSGKISHSLTLSTRNDSSRNSPHGRSQNMARIGTETDRSNTSQSIETQRHTSTHCCTKRQTSKSKGQWFWTSECPKWLLILMVLCFQAKHPSLLPSWPLRMQFRFTVIVIFTISSNDAYSFPLFSRKQQYTNFT